MAGVWLEQKSGEAVIYLDSSDPKWLRWCHRTDVNESAAESKIGLIRRRNRPSPFPLVFLFSSPLLTIFPFISQPFSPSIHRAIPLNLPGGSGRSLAAKRYLAHCEFKQSSEDKVFIKFVGRPTYLLWHHFAHVAGLFLTHSWRQHWTKLGVGLCTCTKDRTSSTNNIGTPTQKYIHSRRCT